MTQTPPPLEPVISGNEPGPSLVGRMLNVFASPGEVFDSIKGKEPAQSNWLVPRSEEHTSELQSRLHLVCRLLLEKKKTRKRAVAKGSRAPLLSVSSDSKCSQG